MEMTSKDKFSISILISTSFCSRFTLIGVNLGRCDKGKPEVYANLLWLDVTKWIKALSEPFRESSICNRATTVPSEISIKYTIRSIVCEASCHHVIMSSCHYHVSFNVATNKRNIFLWMKNFEKF